MSRPYYGFLNGAEIKETTNARAIAEGNVRCWMEGIKDAHATLRTFNPALAEYIYPFYHADRYFGFGPSRGESFLALRDAQGRIHFEWFKENGTPDHH